jgi:SAM-dependent methyltransferase
MAGGGKSMIWSKTYDNRNRVWGEQPGELGLFACNYLKHTKLVQGELNILDVGCGYGRDAIYLAENLYCYILGIDSSQTAIDLAKESCPRELEGRIEFLRYDFNEIVNRYDILFASNLYQILNWEERAKFRETVKRCLRPDGLLFLSTLSVKDPQHFGKGIPVAGDVNSFREDKLLHFCTRDELDDDFDFLTIATQFEQEYNEPHSTEEIHHHISWIMMGKMK